MKRLPAVIMLVLGVHAPAWAAWSILAIEQRTQTMVLASAACVSQGALLKMGAHDLMDLQGIIAPGFGIGAAMGNTDQMRRNQTLIYQELGFGHTTDSILALLKKDSEIETRMYAVIDLRGRMLSFRGKAVPPVALDEQGQVPGQPVFYSVQGFGLASPDVVRAAAAALKAAKGSLTDRAMAAMEAADAKGGDRGCSCNSEPRTAAATCTAKTAHVAYLVRADKLNQNVKTYNDGAYTIELEVTDQNIRADEDANPVKTLRKRYDAYIAEHPELRQNDAMPIIR